MVKETPRIIKIKEIKEENRKVKTFSFDISLNAVPGQFLMVWLPGVNEKPMSILDSNPLKIGVAKVGTFSETLHSLKEGDRIGIRGPYGNGFKIRGDKILLIAGGYGAIPLNFLGREAKKKGTKIKIILGVKTEDELLFLEDFEKLGELIITTEDGSKGIKGNAINILEKELEGIDFVYSCGPEKMMKRVLEICIRKGLGCELSLERYMKCGLGICGSCAINGLLVCKDGPVFRGEDLIKLNEFGLYKRDKSGELLTF